MIYYKIKWYSERLFQELETSLMVQRLKLHSSIAGGVSSDPGQVN